MFQKLLLIILLLIFNSCIFAQTEPATAPIIWQRYKISGQNVSFLFPKLPVFRAERGYCNEEEIKKYTVYAEGIVYGFNISSKMKEASEVKCQNKKAFTESNFTNRIEELKTYLKTTDAITSKLNNFEITKLTGNNTTYWLINDYTNKRWFEFWVTGADEKKKEVTDFISSLNLAENQQGIEIGEGATQNLGDEKAINQTGSIGITPMSFPFGLCALFTEAARKNQTQGTIILRITFLANGSIGTISPVSGLPDGLTEQAIAAAKKIVFIPMQINGVSQTVTKQVQCSFTLY